MAGDKSILALAELYKELSQQPTGHMVSPDKLSALLRFVVSQVAGTEWSSIVQGRPGAFRTAASTDAQADVVDQLQADLGSGPCVDALHGAVAETDDVLEDQRWPEFSRLAAEQSPVRSVLSVRLFPGDDDLVAALNIYSTRPTAFDRDAATVAILLATHASGVLATAHSQKEVLQLQRALSNSRTISTAVGILMAQHNLRRDQAFERLRLVSQHSNRKIADIAVGVLETGTLDLSVLATRSRRRRAAQPMAMPTDVATRMSPVAGGRVAGHSAPPGLLAAAAVSSGPHGGNGRLHRLEGLIDALSDTVTATEVADVLWREGPLTAGVVATGLAVVDREGRRLSFVPSAGHLHSPPLRWASTALTDDLPVAEAARTTSPLYFSEPAALLSRYPALEAAQTATGDKSWAIVPLTGPDAPRGVLTLAWLNPQEFSQDEKNFVATLARLSSAALSRAMLREERRRMAEK